MANSSLAFVLFRSRHGDSGVGEGEGCLEVGSVPRLHRMITEDAWSCEEANDRTQGTHVRCFEWAEPATAARDRA